MNKEQAAISANTLRGQRDTFQVLTQHEKVLCQHYDQLERANHMFERLPKKISNVIT